MTDRNATDNVVNLTACVERRQILKGLVLAGVGITSIASFAGRLEAATAEEVAALKIMVQPGLVPEILNKHSIPQFVSAHPGSSVTLEAGSPFQMYTKILAMGRKPFASGGMFNDETAQRGIIDEMWVKFKKENVPNSQAVPDELMTPGGFGIPFHLTPFGIMYNPDRVEKPKSWTDLFNPKYKGRISMRDAYFAAYVAAAMVSGKGLSAEEGVKVWAKYKDNIGYWADSVTSEADMVSRGEVWIAPQWGAWTEQARVQGKNVAFSLPEEGAIRWTGHMQTLVGFSEPMVDITQQYLDTWNSPECQLAWVTEGFFSPASRNVAIPQNLAGNDAVLSADDLVKKTIPYDAAKVSGAIPDLMKQINRELKS
ncbi:extracellular solute-binding protein [Mesorhizobium sp. B2-6-5]|uniref:ABC transporter substrate-binding protein n=1 Tax=Mesorhizobium sp. B2-6-5 TaxID=2589912 RepID=UPI001126D7EA|nr:extracellular solute-binding protein [Mesorhizobium sp. B2-6-5]TPJ38275.1 extracellular solute-binding protein [Mesorhizobium sp. B2-6-5]